jgi:hypothetical protein
MDWISENWRIGSHGNGGALGNEKIQGVVGARLPRASKSG